MRGTVVLTLAASQVGFLVYSKIILLQASREAARIISVTDNNILAVKAAKRICGADAEINISPSDASQRILGDMVTVSISITPGGLVKIAEKIMAKKIEVREKTSIRMECN